MLDKSSYKITIERLPDDVSFITWGELGIHNITSTVYLDGETYDISYASQEKSLDDTYRLVLEETKIGLLKLKEAAK